MPVPFSIISACTTNYGIGKNNTIPWHIPSDMKYFSDKTTKRNDPKKKNCCIMGKNTYFSIPPAYRPLKDRLNIVLSRNPEYSKILPESVVVCKSLDEALNFCKKSEVVESVFVIGGGQVYSEAINHKYCKKIYITWIHGRIEQDSVPINPRYNLTQNGLDCDVFFPLIPKSKFALEQPQNLTPMNVDKGFQFQFLVYNRCDEK